MCTVSIHGTFVVVDFLKRAARLPEHYLFFMENLYLCCLLLQLFWTLFVFRLLLTLIVSCPLVLVLQIKEDFCTLRVSKTICFGHPL